MGRAAVWCVGKPRGPTLSCCFPSLASPCLDLIPVSFPPHDGIRVFVEDTSGVGDVVTAVLAQLDDVQLREASDDVGDEAPATTSTATTSTAEADAADTGGDDAPPPLDLRENVAYALLTGEDLRSRLRDEHLESYAGLTLPASRQSN